jgi:hypothetical protein
MGQAVSRRPITVEVWARSPPVNVRFVIDKVALRLLFLQELRVSPVSIILPVLRTHLHFNTNPH